ncbi:hypothetical protein ACROYT_G030350 [Oculina patagonica]
MNTTTRSVSFVENLQLEISDNLFNEALLLADVDNDGDSELVVGQINGELSIFKGSSTKPWRSCLHLGMITCVGVGDLWNEGENLLFCITAEGWCHIFYVTSELTEERLEPISSQLLPSNCKVLLLADVDGDGMFELVTGHADRAVYVHKLEADCQEQTDAQSQPNIEKDEPRKKNNTSDTSLGLQANKQEAADEQGTKMTEKLDRKDSKQQEKDAKPKTSCHNEQKVSEVVEKAQTFSYRLVTISHWTVPCQIGSLAVFDVASTRHLLASYPGGTYAILASFDLNHHKLPSDQMSSSPSNSIFKQLPLVYGRNKDIPTNLTTLKCHNNNSSVTNSAEQDQTYLALCTQDGHLILMNGNKLHWSLRINQGCFNLFALSKLDITNDGNEEMAACSWDGDTFIIDRFKNVVQFKFGENVMAFCAGRYAFTPGKNLPSLVYVTSSNRLVVYWNARLSLMVPTNLSVKMRNKAIQDKETRLANKTTSTNNGDNTNDFSQKLYQQCLYGNI